MKKKALAAPLKVKVPVVAAKVGLKEAFAVGGQPHRGLSRGKLGGRVSLAAQRLDQGSCSQVASWAFGALSDWGRALPLAREGGGH